MNSHLGFFPHLHPYRGDPPLNGPIRIMAETKCVGWKDIVVQKGKLL